MKYKYKLIPNFVVILPEAMSVFLDYIQIYNCLFPSEEVTVSSVRLK